MNYIDTKAKCHHLKNWPVKRLFGRFLSEFIDCIFTVSHGWYFRPSFVICCPLTFSLVQLLASLPPPSLCQSTVYTDSVWLGGGGGCWVLLKPYSVWVYLTRFRSYKIARPPQPKTWAGRWPQTDKHLPQSPSIFLDGDIFALVST